MQGGILTVSAFADISITSKFSLLLLRPGRAKAECLVSQNGSDRYVLQGTKTTVKHVLVKDGEPDLEVKDHFGFCPVPTLLDLFLQSARIHQEGILPLTLFNGTRSHTI